MRQKILIFGLAFALAGPALADTASPDRPGAPLIEAAAAALRKGDLQRAIDQYTAIIELPGVSRADKARAELNRGLALQRQGLFARAAQDYTSALSDDVLDARTRSIALYNRGLAWRRLNQPAKAVEDFTSALLLNTSFAEAYMSRGLVMRESAKPYYALDDFQKAIDAKFDRAHLAYYARALVFEELGRPGDAKNELSRALMVKPDFAEARQKIAELDNRPSDTLTLAAAPAVESAVAQAVASQRSGPRVQRQVSPVGDPIVTGSLGNGPRINTAAANLPRAIVPPAHLLSGNAATAPRISAAANAFADLGNKASEVAREAAPDAAPQQVAAADVPSESGQKPRAEKRSGADKAAKPVKVAAAAPTTMSDAAETDSPVTDRTPAAKAVSAVASGWIIQLSSATSESGAWGTWKSLRAKHSALKNHEAHVVRADLGQKGVYYRLRLAGFDSRNEAHSTCNALKKSGLSCFVAKAD